MYNLFYLTKLAETMETTITFCKDIGILPNSVQCPNCKKELVKTYSMARTKAKSHDIRYICHKKVCRYRGKKNTVSPKTGTWFGGSHLSLQKWLFMTYAFVHQLSYADTVRETSIDISGDGTHLLATSIETVSDCKNYCRELCYQVVCDEYVPQIGGVGK